MATVTQSQLVDWTLATGSPASSVTVPANSLCIVSVDSNNSGGTAAVPTSITFNADSSTAAMKDSQLLATNRMASLWYSQKSAARTGTITIAWAAGTTTVIFRVDVFSNT